MNFLSPDYLLAAAAIGLPLLLHMLRRRVTKVVPFPSLRFLTADKPADRRRQSLRRRIVLALRCLALLALALAFARPFLGKPSPPTGRATVIVVDNSYSLHAGSRWDSLKRWAVESAGPFGSSDQVGILLMNPQPAWLVPPTRDVSSALAALNDLQPGWLTTSVEPALRFAGDMLAATPASHRRLVMLGDHQALGWSGADFARRLPPGVETISPSANAAPEGDQAAIADLKLRRQDTQWFADVTVRNFGRQHLRTLRVFIDGSSNPVIDSLDLATETTTAKSIPLPSNLASIDWIRAEMNPDAMPVDDRAWAVAAGESDSSGLVLIDRLGPDAPGRTDFVATALQTLTRSEPPIRTAPATAPEWPSQAVAVLRSPASYTAQAGEKLDAFLKAGGRALLFVDGDPAALAWLKRHGATPTPIDAGEARIRDWAVEHPMVVPLARDGIRSLVGWTFAHGWALPADTVEPIAYWAGGGTALGEMRIGGGRILIAGWSADRAEGDWPISPAFVPFLHRSLAHLIAQPDAAATTTLKVGRPLELPAEGTWQAIDGPATGRPDVIAKTPTPDAPGIYHWSNQGHSQLCAVNLDTSEGDLTPWNEGTPWNDLQSTEPAPATARSQHYALAGHEAEQNSPLWWWCFAALALFLLIELPLANRTSR